MFAKVVFAKEFKKAAHYDLGGGLYARVVIEVQNRRNDRVEIEAQAFEVNANGKLMEGPQGIASRTSGTPHTIELSGVAAGTHSLKPGWVRVIGTYDEATLPPEVTRVTGKPTVDGTIGELVYDTTKGVQYRYVAGELEDLRQLKCAELLAVITQSNSIADLDF